jgi:hypothetical protein
MRPSEVAIWKTEPGWHAGRLECAMEFHRAACLLLNLPEAPLFEIPSLVQIRLAAVAYEDAVEGQLLPPAVRTRLHDLAEMPDPGLASRPEHPPGTAARLLAELDDLAASVRAAMDVIDR